MSVFQGTALVIGAASTIGLAVASRLVQLGCTRLVLVDIDIEALRTTELICRAIGGPDLLMLVRQCDPEVPDALEALMAAVVQKFGGINYCANCVQPVTVQKTIYGATTESATKSYMTIPRSWQRSVWLCMQAEIKCIMANTTQSTQTSRMTQASIVNIAAAQGIASEAGFAPFVAAAHGIVGATRATAMDYLKAGIRVNCVCPGPVCSPGSSEMEFGEDAIILETQLPAPPHGRQITPDDVANAVVFLLGENSAAITGIELLIDCGWSLFHY